MPLLEQNSDTLAARGSHDNAPSLLLVEEEDHDDHGHDVEEFSHHISLLLDFDEGGRVFS